MGRSYWFECARCGYRTKVSGRVDRGVDFWVQTVVCRDCRQLYDAVTRLRVPDQLKEQRLRLGLRSLKPLNQRAASNGPPAFQTVLNRLSPTGIRYFKWVHFKAQCPVSKLHQVEEWNDPDKCPRCGIHLDKSALPYRIWD
ncbi:MAG TPA: hypothetical protein VLT36_09270 [Candidatus Dormibacteraeota bacterium]|nr:hypothetical protein [Candidatus Dormibacteraeota bacterium]